MNKIVRKFASGEKFISIHSNFQKIILQLKKFSLQKIKEKVHEKIDDSIVCFVKWWICVQKGMLANGESIAVSIDVIVSNSSIHPCLCVNQIWCAIQFKSTYRIDVSMNLAQFFDMAHLLLQQ